VAEESKEEKAAPATEAAAPEEVKVKKSKKAH